MGLQGRSVPVLTDRPFGAVDLFVNLFVLRFGVYDLLKEHERFGELLGFHQLESLIKRIHHLLSSP